MEEQIKTAPQTDVEVVDIQFRSWQKIYFFDPDGQRFADGDHIIIDSSIAKIDIIIKSFFYNRSYPELCLWV